MTTYVYQTIPACECEEPTFYEIKQNMKDEALTKHPETGEPIKRVILGGYGLLKKESSSAASPAPQSCCGAGCGCH